MKTKRTLSSIDIQHMLRLFGHKNNVKREQIEIEIKLQDESIFGAKSMTQGDDITYQQ